MGAILEYFKRRATSTVLVAYSVFWAIFHWEGIYTTLFVDQEYILRQHNLLKSEYVDRFFGLHWGTDQIWGDLMRMLFPVVLAYLYVWWLPKLTNKCYKKELFYRNERRRMKIQGEAELTKAEQKKTREETEKVEAEIKLKQKEVEAKELSPEQQWDEEFKRMANTDKGKAALNDLKSLIYEYHGYAEYDGKRRIDVDSQMFFDAYGLVEEDGMEGHLYLTDKGRYFMKQFTGLVAKNSADDEDVDWDNVPF